MAVNLSDYGKALKVAGLFDASRHYGRLFAHGKDALDLLHRMSTNDLKPLEAAVSVAALTVLTNEKGRFVDVIKVVRDETSDVLLITSNDKEQSVIQWLDKYVIMEDARFESASDRIVQFFLCGPKATGLLQAYVHSDLSQGSRSNVYGGRMGNAPVTITKGPSLAGAGWFIFSAAENKEQLWSQLQSDVLDASGAVLDNELFETLRIENGTPVAPNELNEKHNPLETPLAHEAVSFTKGCYIGQEVIARLDAQGKVQRKLVGLKFNDRLPQTGDRISAQGLQSNPLGDEIGDVTSVTVSPRHGMIGLGYVRGKYANPGTVLSVQQADGNTLQASVVTLPFEP
jgi:folate-binding protein YgfZ